MTKSWRGTPPKNCDMCQRAFVPGNFFIDGVTREGSWGLLCVQCHNRYGVGLGEGQGQMYDFNTLLKVEG